MWLNNTVPHKWALDKDISKGFMYCKESVMFVTVQDNNREMINRNGFKDTKKTFLKEGHPMHDESKKKTVIKKISKPIYAISIVDNSAWFFESISQCAKILHLYQGGISNCLSPNHKAQSLHGYKFKFVEGGDCH